MVKNRNYKYIGTSPVRPDGVDKVTGRAQFGADLNLPNMIYGKVLRSPHAHARIKNIDLSGALEIEGVYAAISGSDFPEPPEGFAGGEGGGSLADVAKNVMARDKVLYDGHAVAAVAAKSLSLADAALRAIKVEYELLPPVMDLDTAMADDAPLLDPNCYTKGLPEKPTKPSNIDAYVKFERGDIDKGFAEADVIVEREHRIPMAHQGYIEPHACTASMNESGQASIWACTQGHFDLRAMTAKVLAMDVADVKVTPSEIGGGFGGKLTVYLEAPAVLLSQKTGRPVKMMMDRDEIFRATGPTSGTHCKIKVGAKNDGTITAAEAWLAYEAGAFAAESYSMGAMCIFAPYDLQNFKVEALDVLVNKPKVAAYRAPGAPQSMHAMELAIDELAGELNMDPIDLRLKNAAVEGTQSTYGPKFPIIGLKECLEAAKVHPNYLAPVAEGAGRGVAVGFWFNIGFQSSAEVHVNENGTLSIIEGNPDIGGSRASMCLMAAETLGIPYEDIRIVIGDTESSGYNDVTAGSRTTYATGLAVVQACEDVIADCKTRAAASWGVDANDVTWTDGHAIPPGDSDKDLKPLSFAAIAAEAGSTGGPILGRASLNAQKSGVSFSVNFTDLAVDRETGKVDVLGFTAIQDAGTAIHKAYVEGQMQGGAAQGLGWALNEEYIYNDDGIMQNAGFLDYRMPVASDLPMIDTQIIEVPNPGHPYGVRGVGETPIVAALPAAAIAVRNAIGVRVDDLPLSPPKILQALDAQQ